MKLRLLEHLVCPGCFQAFILSAAQVVPSETVVPRTRCSGLCFVRDSSRTGDCAECGSLEVMVGRLTCVGCGWVFVISGGVPQLLLGSGDADVKKVRTAESFGFLWTRTTDKAAHGGGAHSAKMLAALRLPAPVGTILDAGCGDGSDVAALAGQKAAEVVGVEISDGGTRAAFQRTRALPNAHVVRADLCQLPFRASRFSFIYSYGVIHHVPVPPEAIAELARVSQPDAKAAIYVYEDFSERASLLRWSLRAANVWRRFTTRLPHALLYALCAGGAPFVYLGFTVPHKVLRRVPFCRAVAAGIPFRHGRGPFSLTGDLYDRFSAPVEYRYGRHAAAQLARDAGFSVLQVQNERGWMLELRRDAAKSQSVYNLSASHSVR